MIQIDTEFFRQLGIATDSCSPLPWTISIGYEQAEPGFYIYDAQGIVVLSPDSYPTHADTDAIVQLLLCSYCFI